MVVVMMAILILGGLSVICYADTFDIGTTFTPRLSNVTYNLTRELTCTSWVVDEWCFNITGGIDEYNYCDTQATNITSQILGPYTTDVGGGGGGSSGYTLEEKCINLGGEWVVDEDGTSFYCKATATSVAELFTLSLGAQIFPKNPTLGLVFLGAILYFILVYFAGMPNYLMQLISYRRK